MGKPEVLAKVDADLERGHTHVAAQRLNSLIAADPLDLSLRTRLRDVYRSTGNVAQAGRWGYLTEDVTPAELRSFERAYYRSANDQRRALCLRDDRPPRGLGPLAGERLAGLTASLRAAPASSAPNPVGPSPYPLPAAYDPAVQGRASRGRTSRRPTFPPRDSTFAADAIAVTVLLLVAVLAGLGVVFVISWFL